MPTNSWAEWHRYVLENIKHLTENQEELQKQEHNIHIEQIKEDDKLREDIKHELELRDEKYRTEITTLKANFKTVTAIISSIVAIVTGLIIAIISALFKYWLG